MKICITGGPKTGKTTLANRLADEYGDHTGWAVAHTDDLIATHDWSAASLEVSHWMDAPGPWIIEGVAVSRAIRKWMKAHPGQKPPIDKLIVLTHAHQPLGDGQIAMAKGVATVQAEIEPVLRKFGILIERYRADGFDVDASRTPYRIAKVAE